MDVKEWIGASAWERGCSGSPQPRTQGLLASRNKSWVRGWGLPCLRIQIKRKSVRRDDIFSISDRNHCPDVNSVLYAMLGSLPNFQFA